MTTTPVRPPEIPAVLRKHGFTPVVAAGKQRRRIFISNEGDPATGKTHFIGTAPGPVIAVIDFDRGLEGVLDREEVVAGKLILRKTLPMPDFDTAGSLGMSQGERSLAEKVYADFKSMFEEILLSGQVGTLAIDNCGDAYTIAQMARFGKYAKFGETPAEAWTSMQLEFEQIFRQFYDQHTTNVILTHRQGTKFRGMAGELELKGYKRMQYVAQIHLDHRKDKAGNMKLIVRKCRQRQILEDPEHPSHEFPIVFLQEDEKTGQRQSIGGTFLDVATAVFPNTDESNWF